MVSVSLGHLAADLSQGVPVLLVVLDSRLRLSYATTLLAGSLADRHGARRVLGASMLLASTSLLVYVLVVGAVGVIALLLSGALVVGTFGITIVTSQEYMPGRAAMASGMSLAVARGLGGIAARNRSCPRCHGMIR
jgi:hypothetical protein